MLQLSARGWLALFGIVLVLITMAASRVGFSKTYESEKHRIDVEVLSKDLSVPWGMAFLPDGSLLITERDGALRHYRNGRLSRPLTGVPSVVARGQGGLLDVAVDPAFQDNRFIYLSYSEAGKKGAGTAVIRAKMQDDRLTDGRVIYRQNLKSKTSRHFGSRLVFAKDGSLFITQGDRGARKRAQDPFDHAGSIIRINADGTIPADNPFADGKKALPKIWSTGHRNPQGAAINPTSGALWTVEHGARGGDEINQPKAGKNYGWPTISFGRHYSGLKIGAGTHQTGLEQPLYYWDPSIAPSGLTFYDATLFKHWKGDLFVGALKYQMLTRLEIKGDQIVGEERLLEGEYGRVRDVGVGPDGALYLLTYDGDGYLLRLTPADPS